MKIIGIALFFTLMCSCVFHKEDDKVQVNFTSITKYGLIDIYNEVVLDSNLLLFTKDDGVLQVDPNLKVTQIDDSGVHWDQVWCVNDSLFMGRESNRYFYAKVIDSKLIVDSTVSFTYEYLDRPSYPLYEDDDFEMTSCCMGEFGGTVFIKSKTIPDLEYAFEATCPIQVIRKKHNSYYVLVDLRHLSGHSAVIQINDITKIKPLQPHEVKYCNYFTEYYSQHSESFDPLLYDSLQSEMLGNNNYYIFDSLRIQLMHGFLDHQNELEVLYLSEGQVRYGRIKNNTIEDSYILYNIPGSQYGYSNTLKSKEKIYFIIEEYHVDQSWKGTRTAVSVLVIDQNDMGKMKAVRFKEK